MGAITQQLPWTCIFYDFEKEAMPASYSPQLYILINKEGIKFGFCYGHHIDDKNEMVLSALTKEKFILLKKSLDNDKDLCFFNSANEEVTARPEKLFGKDERIIIKTDKDIVDNWSSSSLLIREFYKDNIPENIEEIIQNTLFNLKDFFLSLLPINKIINKNESDPQPLTQIHLDINKIKAALNGAGLHTSDRLILRLVGSLLTKPFVILTGLFGFWQNKACSSFLLCG
ncbi:MAG: hypothetical protein IPI68_06750 [Chitinophagaceae bacterium]|nr:hypothetical protein [Chitinophagaceae bacterium]